MTTLNNNMIARLLNYGKVSEDQTLAPPKEAGSTAIGSFNFKGRADMPDRLTNNMGDNSMVDSTVDEDVSHMAITSAMLDATHKILTNIGITDSDIALGNVRLKNAQSCMKLVKKVTGQVMDDVSATNFTAELIQQLSMHLSEDLTADDADEPLHELFDMPAESRFTYTIDTLGDVMINDSLKGTSVYLRGSDAVDFLGKLELEGHTPDDIQKVLAHYEHVMEGSDDGVMDEDVKISDYFGATSESISEIESLIGDVHGMKMKMQRLRAHATTKGDVNGKFAAEAMYDELDKLEFIINDYLTKIQD